MAHHRQRRRETGSRDRRRRPIRAGSGGDRVEGGGGDDRIAGGEGRDRLAGGAGDDLIFGFGGSDRRAGSDAIAVRPVGEGFERPVYATAAPGDPGRLYVVEQHSGRIEILDLATGEIGARPFLDLPDGMLADGNEQGLLGLAFHPDYAENRRFFVFLTRADGDVEVRAYRRAAGDPDRAVAASGDTILRIDKDNGAGNHNGGWIGFGPDGMLHVAVGDEGLAGDPANNAQDQGELWGKILRIDVDGDDFAGGARDYAIPDGQPVRRPGRARRGLGARAAQPVAGELRPGDRRLLARRRRAGRARGDRRGSRRRARAGPTSAGRSRRASGCSTTASPATRRRTARR